MKIKPNKQPCQICRNHKDGKPFMLRDDEGHKHPYTHICNCPYCGRFLSENYDTAENADDINDEEV